MTIDLAERVPEMTDAQLKTFKENVQRLQTSGTDRQKVEAERLLPLIVAELAGRKPPPPEPKATVRKKAPAKAKAKAKASTGE